MQENRLGGYTATARYRAMCRDLRVWNRVLALTRRSDELDRNGRSVAAQTARGIFAADAVTVRLPG